MKNEPTQSPVAPRRGAPRRTWLLVALLVALLGVAGYVVGQRLWKRHQLSKVEQALDRGDHEQALARLSGILDSSPDDAPPQLLAARAQRMAGRGAEAAKHLHAARHAGGDPDAIELQSQLLDAASGRLEQVEGTLRRHVDAGHPDKWQILDVVVRAYLARGRAEDAQRDASRWIEQAPDDWRPWFLRAFARTELSREVLSTAFDQAKKDYHRSVELNPDYPPARLLLGNAYTMTGHFADALPHLERYRQLRPNDANGLAEYARCLRGLARVDEARQALDGWLAGHTPNYDVCLVRGQVAIDQGKPDEALDWFRRAEKFAPNAEKTLFHLAEALRAVGRSEEAKTYEEKWRMRQELTKRLTELETAATKEPRNLAVRHEAGVVAFKLGHDVAGRRWLAEALKLDDKHRETHKALADHFEKIGDVQAAAFHRGLAEKRP